MKVKLKDSAVGKSLKVLVYGFLSAGALAVLTILTGYAHAEAAKNAVLGISLAYVLNAAMVAVQKFQDENTPNFPTPSKVNPSVGVSQPSEAQLAATKES